MTRLEKKRFQEKFFKTAGPNAKTLAVLFNRANDTGFYIKDLQGRIVTINRRNLEICNLNDEFDAVGMTSAELFSRDKAISYTTSDLKVIKTGKPVLGVVSEYPADDSRRCEVRDVYPLCNTSGKLIGTACAYILTGEAGMSAQRYEDMRETSDFIQKNYREPIGVSFLAKRTSMSESSFVRAFRRIFASTPGQYVITTRLNAARKLLEETDKTLSEIALECGFCDQSHFCRVFTKERGMTPGEYRRRHHR